MIISCEVASFLPTIEALGEIFISMPKILFLEKHLAFVLCTAILTFCQGAFHKLLLHIPKSMHKYLC